MVIILNYVLLGMLIYAIGIPVLDELSTIIVQGLEIIKGKFLLAATDVQNKINKTSKTEEEEEKTYSNVIGFQIPSEQDYEEDYEEDDE